MGIGDDRAQQPHETVRESGNRRLVEQIRRVREDGRLFAVTVDRRNRQLQIEFRDGSVEVDLLDGQSGQFQPGGIDVLEEQRHLEQRMVRRRPDRIQDLDQPLEGQFGVRERGQVRFAYPVQQIDEARAGFDLGAQHQGVDEHADEIVELAFTTPGHRGAQGDIRAAGQPRQQCREGRVHHHELGRVAGAGDLRHGAMRLRRDRERIHPADARGRLRPRPVRGQVDPLRRVGQRRAPERQLLRRRRLGIVLVAEQLPLPQRVVRVLHRQRRPRGRLTRDARQVGGHQVPDQRRHRRAVRRDVVRHHDHHVHVGGRRQHRHPQRHLGRDVESAQREAGDPVHHSVFADLDDRQIRHRGRGQHVLIPHAVHGRVDGPQHLVPGDHVTHGRSQRRQVQLTRQPDGEGNVVGRGGGVELVEEPHPLLCQRQRHQLRPRPRHQCGTLCGRDGCFGANRQLLHRRRLEQVPDRDRGAERGVHPCDDPGGDQGVAAQGEEVVVAADPLGAEHVGEHPGDRFLDRRDGSAELALPQHLRLGQRTPVQFAVRSQRQRLQHHDHVGNHVAGEEFAHRRAHRSGVGNLPGLRDDVTDQPVTEVVIGVDHRHGLADAGAAQQRGLDLTQFDTEAAQLYLLIAAPGIFQGGLTVETGPAADIARAVHARTGRPERVRHESSRGQARAAQVSARQLASRDVHLAGDTDGSRMQAFVEDVGFQARQRLADHAGRMIGQTLVERQERHVHRGFGDAVHVHQSRRGRTVPLVPAAELAQIQGLATEDDVAQGELARTRHRGIPAGVILRGAIGLGQLIERRRRLVQHRDLLANQQLAERFRRTRGQVIDHDHRTTGGQRTPQLPHREVEGEGVEQRPHIGLVEVEQQLRVREQLQHVAMGDAYALGHTGGTRGVDDIGQIGRAQRTHAVAVGDRSVGEVPGLFQQHRRQFRGGQFRPHGGRGEHTRRLGIRQHEFQPLRGVAGVDRQVGRARQEDTQQRDGQFLGPRNRHRHQGFRAHALSDERARHTIGAPQQLTEGDGGVAEPDGHRARAPLRLRLDQIHQRHRRDQRPG
ncbi:hypothetical protein B7C42_03540 [Nocardia cerradoensis]|uniref:Uncharacterized protein n=1 Tax=Nocardia cerradoensis TaxID=85688 RepID=A0A231H7C5_9NOCA|nr:hypothetical protein B7C42_03540 [Nocardia cerradoensis]